MRKIQARRFDEEKLITPQAMKDEYDLAGTVYVLAGISELMFLNVLRVWLMTIIEEDIVRANYYLGKSTFINYL